MPAGQPVGDGLMEQRGRLGLGNHPRSGDASSDGAELVVPDGLEQPLRWIILGAWSGIGHVRMLMRQSREIPRASVRGETVSTGVPLRRCAAGDANWSP